MPAVPVSLDHTIIYVRDRHESATFFTALFGLPDPVEVGQFLSVPLDGGVTLDFARIGFGLPVVSQHYAFLVSEQEFDQIYRRIEDQEIEHWADARGEFPGAVNTDDGKGVHFLDPNGHRLELRTNARPGVQRT